MQTSTPILAPEDPPRPDPLGRLATLPFLGVVAVYIGGMMLLFWRIRPARDFYVMPIAFGASIVLTRVLRRRLGLRPNVAFTLAMVVSLSLGIATLKMLEPVGR